MGVYLVAHRGWASLPWMWLRRWRASVVWLWVSRVLLFHAICLGWVFFRSPTLTLARTMLLQFRVHGRPTLASWPVVAVLVLGVLGQYAPRAWRRFAEATMTRMPAFVNGAALALGVYVIELLGPSGVAPFIYFQF
jgi:D-alanyl-lipoteichoic acid acyltransferase DltB (MBOAT superfamily)